MHADALAALERDARSRQVQQLIDAAKRMEANGDRGFAAELRAETLALNGDPMFATFAELPGESAIAKS